MSDHPNEPPPLHVPTPQEVSERLAFDFPELLRRRDELLQGLAGFLAVHATIDDPATQGAAAENRRMVQALGKSAEGHRVEAKAPFLLAEKALDAWFHRVMEPLETPLKRLTSRMTDFGVKLEDERRREAAEAAAKARALADRKARDAAEALAQDPEQAEEAVAVAAAAEQMAEGAEQMAAAPASDLSRVHGEFGAVASLRRQWKWREVDHSKVPRDLMEVVSAKVVARIKLDGRDANGVPRSKIPGIEIYEVKTV